MAGQTASLVGRLCEADSPHSLDDWEKKDGYYATTCRVSANDVPSLIDIAVKWCHPDWPDDDAGFGGDTEDVEFLPVTAWRALADLKSADSVEPLIDMLCQLDDEFDEWAATDMPHVFGKIGKPSIGSLVGLANDTDRPEFARVTAAESLRRVAEYHPESRDEAVAHLTEMMSKASRDDIRFNTELLVGLVELRAVKAAEAIERAFAADCLDAGMIGDWEYVRLKLGVEGLRLAMPKYPHNSLEQFRRRMGIGIFSDEMIFDYHGERVADAEHAYYERAWDVFSKSNEAQQVIDRFGDLQWFGMLLSFGLDYRGEIVDEMTVVSIEEFVCDYVPRKVSTEPEQAAYIISELTSFWEYVDRVFELQHAEAIVQWLKADGRVSRLKAALSDRTNFGMAKSLFMRAKEAGYDVTSEEEMAEFMMEYNRSLPANAAPPPPTPVSGRRKTGRNDPCPCGSGKKYKKCCL